MATIGIRDQKADPVVKVTTYGRPADAFTRVVEVAVGFGFVERTEFGRPRPPSPPAPTIPLTALDVFERRWAERVTKDGSP